GDELRFGNTPEHIIVVGNCPVVDIRRVGHASCAIDETSQGPKERFEGSEGSGSNYSKLQVFRTLSFPFVKDVEILRTSHTDFELGMRTMPFSMHLTGIGGGHLRSGDAQSRKFTHRVSRRIDEDARNGRRLITVPILRQPPQRVYRLLGGRKPSGRGAAEP